SRSGQSIGRAMTSAGNAFQPMRAESGIGANIREAKATANHARSSLRHGHQLDDMAVVVLVIEAAAAIPSVELSVFKSPGPASEGEPSVLDPLQDRVEFGVAYLKRIMLACDRPLRISEVQRQCVVDAHRRK